MGGVISRKRSSARTGDQKSPAAMDEPKIAVRPMLTTSQKNFRDVRHPPSILSPADGSESAITREELNVRGARCFLLHSLLSPDECRHYIEDTERIGYSDLLDLFQPEYRSNDRVLAVCQPLVDRLWARLQHHLSRREVIRIRPIGFGNEGTWKPFRLNECCKFGKYKPGGHFSPHLDGPWVPHEDESSVFTVVIYLNSDFQGGETCFLDEDTRKEACVVTPKQGTALVFNHDTLHEGLPVTAGLKYILRTEIMYRRVDREMIPDPMSYQTSEDYLSTLALYQKSWELEQEGDSQGFNDTYLEALRQQREAQRSVGSDAGELFQQPLPYEVYLKIFGYLSPSDLCQTMRVCKVWYDMAMDGQLWYDMYKQKWPIGIGLEAQLDHTKTTLATPPPPFIKDWYGLFKQRVKMKSPAHVMVVDLGSFSCKCAVVDRVQSRVKTITIESVVAVVPGVFDLHLRRGEWERYFSGKDAKENFPDHLVNVVEKGIPVRAELLPEIVTGFYYACSVPPKYTPVVILEPPGLWTPITRSQVGYTFIKMFQQRSVSFLSSAVATLCGVELTSGVVVDVGHGVATCCVVWEGEETPRIASRDPLDCTAAVVAQMVHSLVAQCSDERKTVLRERVVVTGGKAPKASSVEVELMKIDLNYSVIEPRSTVYSGVGGGCMLTSLINFPARQESSALENMDPGKVTAMNFYQITLGLEYYWVSRFMTEEEEAEKEMYGEEESVDEEEEGRGEEEEGGGEEEEDGGEEEEEGRGEEEEGEGEEEEGGWEEEEEGGGEEEEGRGEEEREEGKEEGGEEEKKEEQGEEKDPSEQSDGYSEDEENEEKSEESGGEESEERMEGGAESEDAWPDLEMAGVLVPVLAQQVDTTEADPECLGYYKDRLSDPYVHHDDRTVSHQCI